MVQSTIWEVEDNLEMHGLEIPSTAGGVARAQISNANIPTDPMNYITCEIRSE